MYSKYEIKDLCFRFLNSSFSSFLFNVKHEKLMNRKVQLFIEWKALINSNINIIKCKYVFIDWCNSLSLEHRQLILEFLSKESSHQIIPKILIKYSDCGYKSTKAIESYLRIRDEISEIIHSKEEMSLVQKKKILIIKRILEDAALEGSTEALTNLGVFYLKGIHGEENYNMGFSLTKHAADLGNIYAKSNLAYLYKMSHEYKNAYDLCTYIYNYSKDIDKIFIDSIDSLSIMYLNGLGVNKDEKKGQELFAESNRLKLNIY